MGQSWGAALRCVCGASFLLAVACATPADAQQTKDEVAARKHFEAGRAAFEKADYRSALVQFRRSHRMFPSPALLYNIGVSAERLHREHEALEAFEWYLEEVESPADEAEVRDRITALRASIARRQSGQRALMSSAGDRNADGAFHESEHAGPVDQPSAKKKWPWLVASAAVVAVAGVTAGLLVSQGQQDESTGGGLKVEW